MFQGWLELAALEIALFHSWERGIGYVAGLTRLPEAILTGVSRPRRGEGQEARSNAHPCTSRRLVGPWMARTISGELAEWLKAHPC